MYIDTKQGKRLRQMTVDWDLSLLWKDGTQQWLKLNKLKESNPLEVAEYT